MSGLSRSVVIRANEVRDLGEGKFAINMECRELSGAEHALLQKLFPNTGTGIERLLCTEALAQAVLMD